MTLQIAPATALLVEEGLKNIEAAEAMISGIGGLHADFDGDVARHVPGIFVIPKKFRKHAKQRAKASHKRSRAHALLY